MLLLHDARVVLADRVLDRGWVAVEDGRIAGVGEGDPPPGHGARGSAHAVGLGGDHLIPGLVELHTDHLEVHFAPRPGVRWHALGAVLAFDAQMAAAGATTVFACLRAGQEADGLGGFGGDLMPLGAALAEARDGGLARCDLRTHLRCEVAAPDAFEAALGFLDAGHPVHLASLMDHTPGSRQYRDVEKYLAYAKRRGRGEAEMRALLAIRQAEGSAHAARNRPRLAALLRARGVPLASHDDTTEADVAVAVAEGATVAEFPTTPEAARAARASGLAVLMGAPNLVRGGSHGGNVAAEALAAEGLLDVLSSDYVPASLPMAAFDLPRRVPAISLPEAVATVTRNPARAVGLADRGEIAVGLRADLARVRLADGGGGGVPVVRGTWRGGERVA